jgi:large subunit ribosomal protein L21
MYAIIETGGKQYRVEKGDIIYVELLEDKSEGKVTFDTVLFLHNGSQMKTGLPHVKGGAVHGELLGEARGPKVIAYKYKQRKNYRRKVGHRQNYSKVKITDIIG